MRPHQRQLIDILEPNSVDLILTDPPYEREFLPVYEDLAKLAAHVLKPGLPFLGLEVREWAPGLYLGSLSVDGIRMAEVKFNIAR